MQSLYLPAKGDCCTAPKLENILGNEMINPVNSSMSSSSSKPKTVIREQPNAEQDPREQSNLSLDIQKMKDMPKNLEAPLGLKQSIETCSSTTPLHEKPKVVKKPVLQKTVDSI